MKRRYIASSVILLTAMSFGVLADDLKVFQLEQEVRELKIRVEQQAQRIHMLEQAVRNADTRSSEIGPTTHVPSRQSRALSDAWLKAANWERIKLGMTELHVIEILGAPSTVRKADRELSLLYALEIGADSFLSGAVELRDRAVTAIRTPTLK